MLCGNLSYKCDVEGCYSDKVVTATERNSVNYWERGHALRLPENDLEENELIPIFLVKYAQEILIGNALGIMLTYVGTGGKSVNLLNSMLPVIVF